MVLPYESEVLGGVTKPPTYPTKTEKPSAQSDVVNGEDPENHVEPDTPMPSTKNFYFEGQALRHRVKRPPESIQNLKNMAAEMFVLTKGNGDQPAGQISAVFNRFFLTDVQMQRTERVQISETFGEPVVYFFDEKVKIYSFAGSLLEAHSLGSKPRYNGFGAYVHRRYKFKYLWGSALQNMYDTVMRGTKLAQAKSYLMMAVGNHMIYGYPINLNIRETANVGNSQAFSFSMIIERHDFVDPEVRQLYSLDQFGGSDVFETLAKIEAELASAQERLKEAEDKRSRIRTDYTEESYPPRPWDRFKADLLGKRAAYLTAYDRVASARIDVVKWSAQYTAYLSTLESKYDG